MNLMFIMVACFTGLVLAVVIATAAIKILGGQGLQPPRWMGRMRRVQYDVENSGWRIQMIPYDVASQPLTVPSRGLLAIVPILGMFGFLIGIGLAVYDRSRFAGRGVLIAVSSWLIAWVVAWANQRWGDRPLWDVAQGRCVDRELRKVLLSAHGGGRWGWAMRIVSEYEYLGIRYRVTPEICPDCFGSEQEARAFLDQRISPSGGCTLRVNPKNPLQTGLIDQGNGSIAL